MAVVVLDEGPIAHADIERYDEPDLDAAVEHYGVATRDATYRLLLIDVDAVLETRWFSKTDKRVRQDVIDAAAQGRPVPPIIVYRATDNADLFGLLDGVNRTFAYWSAGLLVTSRELV